MPVLKKKTSRAIRAGVGTVAKSKFRGRSRDASLDKALRKWRGKVRPLIEAARSSEQLSEDDLAIRINARG